MEKVLLIVKPDGVQRGLVGKVIARFEERGLKIAGLKLMKLSKERAEELYAPHRGKPFYEPTVKFMTSSPLVAMVMEGRLAITLVRTTIGATKPQEALPGTIRGDFSTSIQLNIVHASDSPENAEREIAIFFDKSELLDYPLISETWSGNQKEAGLWE
ncbi:MAG: nucleoside-diphosphate kinase [Elusimicrobiota bacterium]